MNYTATLPVVLQKNEVHNNSQVILKVYRVKASFCFSINCKLGRFIRSYYPTPQGEIFQNTQDAQAAAISMLKSWVSNNRNAKKKLADFALIEYRQPELFRFDDINLV
ncbi:MAG: hypothetical protein J6T20_04725 [Treponema sp.]|nr:hypothetical protein [Treponema sp.]